MCLFALLLCAMHSQLMFTQSVVVKGSGFPVFATYVAVIKEACREITASLEERNILFQQKYI